MDREKLYNQLRRDLELSDDFMILESHDLFNDLEADSIDSISLLLFLESEGIFLEEAEIEKIRKVGDLLNLIHHSP
jgi:acyl carrier protein